VGGGRPPPPSFAARDHLTGYLILAVLYLCFVCFCCLKSGNVMIVSDNHSFQKRLMCEVEFFGRCFEERTLPFLSWSKLPPAIFKYPDS